MQDKRIPILVFIYNSFNDPLFKGLLFRYIKSIAQSQSRYRFHIITFEQDAYHIPSQEKEEIKKELSKISITWHPLKFHTGRFLLIKKLYDLLQAFFRIVRIHFKYKPRVALAFANIAGSFVYLLSKVFSWRIIVFSYEPHSQFLQELGFWNKTSLKYKLLHSTEKKLGIHGDYIITGTKHMIQQLNAWKSKAETFRLPTSIDQEVFNFSEKARKEVRGRLNIENRRVIIYTGKFGDLYYKEEIFDLCSTLYEDDSSYFFLFLTGHDQAEITTLFSNVKIPKSAYFVGRAPFEKVNEYLSAADMGLVTVANFPSKKFCSPTKVGEYLCCGIPYIVTKGTSEDDDYAEKYNVGVVVKSFAKRDVKNQIEKINSLLSEDRVELRNRCRATGIEYRGMGNAIKIISQVLVKATRNS